jgi:hypothetical protein
MHRNALRDPEISQDAKTNLGVMCPDALFVKSVPVQPEYEKLCDHILRPRHNGMHYMTRRSHQMQKHKFSVRVLVHFLWEPHRTHPSMKNIVSSFRAPDAPECTMSPEDPTGCKNIGLE